MHWVDYAHSEDGGRTWSEPRHTDVVGQNMNAWVTARGTLIAACRGIDGTSLSAGGADPAREPPVQRSGRLRDPLLHGRGSRRRLTVALPVHAARSERGCATAPTISRESPSMCNLPDGRVMVVYYSYDESIFCGLGDENCLNPLIRSEMERIPHVFKRRPCRAILTETGDAG